MSPLPRGTVTFLFTDIEGSTKLWQQDPNAMKIALERHHVLVRHAIETNGGYVFQIVGDAFCAAFHAASDGVAAALAAQRAIVREPWDVGPIRVRMALHSGTADVRAGEYKSGEYVSGLTLSRTARLLSSADGGQILVSQATQGLVRDQLPPQTELRDLGNRRLKDLTHSEQVFQLANPDLPSNLPALRSLDVIPNNMPERLTTFVGRNREMSELKRLLAAARLLTMTGTGGSGKTRLALEVAADLMSRFDDGVWLIELAGILDPVLVPQVAAAVLKVREEPGRPLVQAIVDSLRAKRMLLVFDNCEHLIPACATLVDSLLRSLPHLTVLATSREPLAMSGETVWPVPLLSLPDPRRRSSAAEVVTYDAVRLFIARAEAAFPGFTVTDQNAVAVATVCQRLDGIPLAIELAAARLTSLTVEQIAARLDDRFRLLTRGNRTALPKHQTLHTAIDSSYDLLSDKERALFRRLSVFAGGFTLDAARRVCQGGNVVVDEIVELLTLLVDKSLVSVDRGVKVRYRLLETLREYGAEKLRECGEVAVWRTRHRDWLLELVVRSEPELRGPVQGAWLEGLDAEHDNLRAALEWSKTEDNGETGLRLAAASWRFWQARGCLSEGRAWLEATLRHAGTAPASERAKALIGAGNLAYMQGDYTRAEALYQESLALSRELGDSRRVASVLNNLGLIRQNQGDCTEAGALCEESLALRRKLGDRLDIADSLNNLVGITWALGDRERAVALCEEALALWRELGHREGIAGALNNLGLLARHRGDYARARILYGESLAVRRTLGDKIGIADSLANLGSVARCLEEHDQAYALYQESLALYRDVGANLAIAECFKHLASVACAQRQYERGTRLFGIADTLRASIGASEGAAERAEIDRDIASARAALGDNAVTRALETGRTMALDAALTYAIGDRD